MKFESLILGLKSEDIIFFQDYAILIWN